MNNKIRKVDSFATAPTHARAYHGPATVGMDFDIRAGLVLNADGIRRVGTDRSRYVERFDDFLGDALAGDWNFQEGSDSGTSDAAIVVALGGVVRLSLGDSATLTMAGNGAQFEGQLNWQANQGNLVFETRLQLSSIADIAVFAGFTDQVAALEMPVTLSTVTFTKNATDLAGVLFDTAATTDTWRSVGKASEGTFGVAPVAATYETFRVEIDKVSGNATYYRNGTLLGTLAAAVAVDAPLVPVIAAFSRAAAAKTIDVDYIYVGMSR